MTIAELLADPTFWYIQSAFTVVLVVLFAVIFLRAAEYGRKNRDSRMADHGAVVAATLMSIAFWNILTTYGTAIGSSDLRDFGGLMVRGTLGIVALYLLLLGPFRGGR